jgi:hypothetical protein
VPVDTTAPNLAKQLLVPLEVARNSPPFFWVIVLSLSCNRCSFDLLKPNIPLFIPTCRLFTDEIV